MPLHYHERRIPCLLERTNTRAVYPPRNRAPTPFRRDHSSSRHPLRRRVGRFIQVAPLASCVKNTHRSLDPPTTANSTSSAQGSRGAASSLLFASLRSASSSTARWRPHGANSRHCLTTLVTAATLAPADSAELQPFPKSSLHSATTATAAPTNHFESQKPRCLCSVGTFFGRFWDP